MIEFKKIPAAIEIIKREVYKYFKCDVNSFETKTKKPNLVLPKKYVFYFINEFSDLKGGEIAELTKIDQAMEVYYRKHFLEDLQNSPEIQKNVNHLRALISKALQLEINNHSIDLSNAGAFRESENRAVVFVGLSIHEIKKISEILKAKPVFYFDTNITLKNNYS